MGAKEGVLRQGCRGLIEDIIFVYVAAVAALSTHAELNAERLES